MPTPDNSDDLKLSLEHRIDAVCTRFEAAWKAGQRPNLEEFLAGWEGPEQAALEKELRLIHKDYLNRAKAPEQSQSARNPVATGDFNPPTMTYIGDATVTFTGEARPAAVSNDLPNLGLIAGRYRLIKKIADGGMGSVYLAEQIHPIKRRVALKLIKSGVDSRSVLARFDAERQALALMDHPNIARIYDGGLTESYIDPEGRHVHGGGQPFFVMELVEGVPMTEYCDTKRLTIDARLQLFILVCMAVQHAHQKGIIHRDLKPGNVLVTEVDGKPTPKVIDFGVAKATEQKLTDLSYIDSGIIVGTPAYMSPEQADPEEYDVDTRSDVYALGVMLYELLVGSLPIEPEQFERGAVLEMLRMVREVDPPRPSTRLSSAQKLPNIAANRDIEPAVLAKLLSGELDWVVMKALEKDRTRRYESVIALAEDLQNYLSHEVVKARPPSRYYRLRKFVRRHRGAVFASLLVLFAVLTGMIGVVIQWREAVFERDQKEIARAQAVSERDLKEIARAEAIKNARVAMEQRRLALDTMGEIILHARSEMAPRQELQGAVRTLLQIARKSLDRVAQNPDVEVSLNDTTLALIHDMEARAARDAKDLPAAIKKFSQAASIFQSIINRANDGLEKDVLIKNLVVVLLGRRFVNLMSSNQALAYADFLQAAKVLDTVKDKSARDYYNLLVSVYTSIGIVTIDKNPRLAREHYRGMLKVKEGLSRQEAVDGKAITEDTRRDLIKLSLLVGNGEHRTRNADAADMIYTKAIADAEAWLASKPDDKLRKNLLANALELRGDLRLRTGKAVDAASDYAAAAGHFLAITTADARNEDARADLSRIRYSQGLAAISANNKPRAAELFLESLTIRRGRPNLDTDLVGKKDLMMSLARTGYHAEAIRLAEAVRSKLATDPGSLVDVANCYAVCAAYLLATGNDKVTQDRYTKQAIEAIRQAIAIDYGDKVNLETEPDLDGIRNQPEFRKLLESMREP